MGYSETFYYFDGGSSIWQSIYSSATILPSWSNTGNSAMIEGTNFVGTTDAVDLTFKSNNLERFRINYDNGVEIAPLSFASSNGLSIGGLTGSSANTSISTGAISGSGTSSQLSTGSISSTGSTAEHITLGNVTGNNASSHGSITMGNISGTTASAYGINTGTITGGTNSNTGIGVGSITSSGASNSYGINVNPISGSGNNNYGINIDTQTSTGTISTAINVSGLSGAATTNTGLNIGTISGGTSRNYGLRLSGTAAATNNYAIYADAAAQNYLFGNLGINALNPASLLHVGGTAQLGTISATTGSLRFFNSSNAFYTAIESSASTTANTTYILPTSDGSNRAVLSTDGSANLSWKNNLFVLKAADQSVTNSTTLVNDSELFVSLAANTNYIFEGYLIIDCSNTAPDIKFAVTAPSGVVFNITLIGGDNGTNTDESVLNTSGTAGSRINISTVSAVLIKGIVKMGSTAGPIRLQWTQNAAGAQSVFVRANSWILAHQL
jgi:trimeric autotransporter adhesin